MSAKNAELQRTRSHYVTIDHKPEIEREEVYFDITAEWRSAPVIVEMAADRYRYSDGEGGGGLTEWRIVSRDARFNVNDERGGPTTGNARSALGEFVKPLVEDWLNSDAYTESFKRALGHSIMRYFQDNYSAIRYVSEAIIAFRSQLDDRVVTAILKTVEARKVYESMKDRAFQVIDGDA